jgi:hypothetical protein
MLEIKETCYKGTRILLGNEKRLLINNMTEYLYDRENPKSAFRQRSTGIEGLFYGLPNMNERADMIGR